MIEGTGERWVRRAYQKGERDAERPLQRSRMRQSVRKGRSHLTKGLGKQSLKTQTGLAWLLIMLSKKPPMSNSRAPQRIYWARASRASCTRTGPASRVKLESAPRGESHGS